MSTTTLRTDNGIRYETRENPEGESATDRAGNVLVYCVCLDCRAWCLDGQALKHSRRCDTPNAHPTIRAEALTTPSARATAAAAQRSAAQIKRRAREGVGLTPDEVFEAHERGQITTSEAMNRDD